MLAWLYLDEVSSVLLVCFNKVACNLKIDFKWFICEKQPTKPIKCQKKVDL